jgi:hypothetical protein
VHCQSHRNQGVQETIARVSHEPRIPDPGDTLGATRTDRTRAIHCNVQGVTIQQPITAMTPYSNEQGLSPAPSASSWDSSQPAQALPLVQDEEPVRNQGETRASIGDCLDGSTAGRSHYSDEAADSL